ncbi:AAA family ATPase [Hyphomicrobium sp. 1Nfss2.1]|uniref:AAA family ATPase n=1 Tax=Hyphomicrobium sp. 1Nfss2.1 TaxID=3413936 RepID=UPI003C7A3D21
MRTWALVQQKGGSGKSTLATNLAVAGEQAGEIVLIVDLDPQRSAVLWHDVRGNDQPAVTDTLPQHLGKVLEAADENGATLAIVDTAGELDEATLAALKAADVLICPTRPDLFNLASLKETVALLGKAGKLPKAVAVINAVNESGAAATVGEARAVLKTLKLTDCPVVIYNRPAFAAASNKGRAVIEVQAKGKAADEIRELYAWLDENTSKRRRKSK